MDRKLNSSEKKKIAYRLQNFRLSNSLLQKEIANKLDMSLSGVKKVETGQTNVTVPYLMKMHEEYGLSADYVLFGKSESVDDVMNMISCFEYQDKLLLLIKLFSYLNKINNDGADYLSNEEMIKLIMESINKKTEE